MTDVLPPVSDTLNVGDLRLKMTYGLLADVCRIVPDGSVVAELVLTDSYARDFLMRRALTPIKGMIGSEAELIKAEDIELSMTEVSEVLDWVVAHVLGFWMRSAQSLRNRGQALKELAKDPLMLSTDGSPA